MYILCTDLDVVEIIYLTNILLTLNQKKKKKKTLVVLAHVVAQVNSSLSVNM